MAGNIILKRRESRMKQLIEDIKKIKLRRGTVELLTVVIIIILGMSVFMIPIKREGTLSYDNGSITYSGKIANNRMNGQGKLTYKNGDTYEGSFKNGVFSGQGTYTSEKGWTYIGEFKKGQPDGQGTLKTTNGKTYKGKFKQGIYQK
ncbi:signal peptide [Streptococcus acidominimus]|uniref:Signal peptide n=2 Tax=Streptococcus TaxID=1301 RepID=A0A239WCP2_STRAI|nr:signal peptide [Streptococcus acidominimus]